MKRELPLAELQVIFVRWCSFGYIYGSTLFYGTWETDFLKKSLFFLFLAGLMVKDGSFCKGYQDHNDFCQYKRSNTGSVDKNFQSKWASADSCMSFFTFMIQPFYFSDLMCILFIVKWIPQKGKYYT